MLTLQLLHYGYCDLWPATSHSNLQKEDRRTDAETSKGSPLGEGQELLQEEVLQRQRPVEVSSIMVPFLY